MVVGVAVVGGWRGEAVGAREAVGQYIDRSRIR